MSAFCASMKLKPRLQPQDKDLVTYESLPAGARIDVRCDIDINLNTTKELNKMIEDCLTHTLGALSQL